MTRSRRQQIKKKIDEALEVLAILQLPDAQQNDRSALTLLALLNLKPTQPWHASGNPMLGVTPIMMFADEHYEKHYQPNSRETFRRFTLHQFVEAGLVIANPDKPRPTNSPKFVYQIAPAALELLRTFHTPSWHDNVTGYLANSVSLREKYASEREGSKLPLILANGKSISLSPGGQNETLTRVINEFCPRFTPGAIPVYIGDTADKWLYFDLEMLEDIGVKVDEHGKIPDIVVYDRGRNWLVLIEVVTSHGPMTPKRVGELKVLFKGSTAGLVFVSAFSERTAFVKYVREIAWETEVWIADAPSHMIHFNGERFLGPYEA